MSKIFELYGYPVDTWDNNAWENLKSAHCPFMNAECDGGGNRFSSGISLSHGHGLRSFFNQELNRIQAGVCSLQLREGAPPWIVCPRRLLNFRFNGGDLQTVLRERLYTHAGLKKRTKYNVWSEVKMKCEVTEGNKTDLFDYTFDYVIASTCRKSLNYVANLINKSSTQAKRLLENLDATLIYNNGQYWFDDFPDGPPVIIEVMTSSTSGGNERNRTQVGQVFEDTIYELAGREITPDGPGINYRQVWARMVSQLLVKSQIGVAWGGMTFWIIQDLLADYISKTTALDLNHFLSQEPSEVNLISGGYNRAINPRSRGGQLIDIPDIKMFAGPVSMKRNDEEDFSDIVKLGCTPPIDELWRHLVEKKPCDSFTLEPT